MLNVDVIKIAYRQTKDGFVVTFALHPQDKHDELALADIGSQWNMRLTPLDENGNPNAGDGLQASPDREAVSSCEPAEPKRAPASRLTMQARKICGIDTFWQFLRENGHPVASYKDTSNTVKLICHVDSKDEFIPGTSAGNRWEALYNKFLAWRDVPEANAI